MQTVLKRENFEECESFVWAYRCGGLGGHSSPSFLRFLITHTVSLDAAALVIDVTASKCRSNSWDRILRKHHGQPEGAVIPRVPQILRTSITQVILQLSKLGVGNIVDFPWIDPPPSDTVIRSLEELESLGALTPQLHITPLGIQMSHLPLDPNLAATLLQVSHHQPFPPKGLESVAVVASHL